MRIRLTVSSLGRDTHSARLPSQLRPLFGFANPTVQQTEASRVNQAQIQRHQRLAPVADLFIKPNENFTHVYGLLLIPGQRVCIGLRHHRYL